MAGLGHNGGPTMEPGAGWRRYAWGRARAELLPHMPLNVVRRRVARAKELGLDYRTYATVCAASGRDSIAFLFSSNALRLARDARIEAERAARLAALAAVGKVSLVHPPLDPVAVLAVNLPLIDAAGPAPGLVHGWSATRAAVRSVTTARGLPAAGVLVVGETALEREWLLAGRCAGFLDAGRYFGPGA